MSKFVKNDHFSAEEQSILNFTLFNHEYLDILLVNYAKVQFGWTALQFSCIAYLKRFGKLSMSELARSLFVSKQQATQLISSLVKHGLAKREQDNLNRRVIYVSPTELAITQLLQAERAFLDTVSDYFETINAAEKSKIIDAMKVMTAFTIRFGEDQLALGANLTNIGRPLSSILAE